MSANPPVVLIVEDHSDSLLMYALGLELMGLKPITAENAELGFERACEFHPDVVALDLWLPGASGLDLARRMRQDARTRHAAIVAITGDPLDSTRAQARAAGCDRLLLKPCAPDELAREIADLLASRDLHEPDRPLTDIDGPESTSYQQAFERIRADYQEMPGMRLTAQQMQRLCGIEELVCRRVLDDLVRLRFLRVGPDGLYTRTTAGRSVSGS